MKNNSVCKSQSFSYPRGEHTKIYIDYEHSVVQVMNAIRSYYQLPTHHESDHDIAGWLDNHQFNQVIVLLIDGMGSCQIKTWCDALGPLKSYHKKDVKQYIHLQQQQL